jgi:peptidoglycan/LPS O-acetylase OafA/YrhL
MNKPARMLMLAGVVALLIGAFLAFAGGPPGADAALEAKCRANMTARNADAALLAQCKEAAFATAMTATDANAAARAISAANNSEIGGNALAMFLMGFGVVLLLVGFAKARKGQDRLS